MRKKIIITKTKARYNFKQAKMYILTGVCGLMIIASIFITIESSTNGAEFASLQKQEAELLSHQQDLQQTLVESLSVNTLQEQSSSLGFMKLNTLVYVTNTDTANAGNGILNTDPVAKLP